MRWPWHRQDAGDHWVVSWCGQTLAYVQARRGAEGAWQILKSGVEQQGSDSTEDFVHRLQGLGLKGAHVHAMLRPEQYQVLQVEAPAVPPEELRAAARYQIREMLQTHVDDVTLDVMRVGSGAQKGVGLLFVVVTANAVVREINELGQALGWTVSVIDIQETAQRNLQTALAALSAQVDRAQAALVLVDGQQAVLTISAHEELYYTRRFELPAGFLTGSLGLSGMAPADDAQAFSPVDEYVPEYSVGGVSYGTDYSEARALPPAISDAAGDGDEAAQRFLVEVQRSLDVWDRSWSSLPLNGIYLYAASRTQELANWLALQLGQSVAPLNVQLVFAGFEDASVEVQALCLPLLGVLLRVETRQP